MKVFHSINSFLETLGIECLRQYENFFIYRIEDYFGKEKLEIGPFKYDFFELTFGSGQDVDISIGNASFNSIENTLSFTTPYQISSWKVNSFQKDSIGYMILFKPELFNLHYTNRFDFYRQFSFLHSYSTPSLLLSDKQKSIVLNLMQTMHQEFNSAKKERKEIVLGAYLTILLEKVNDMFSTSHSNKVFTDRAEEITFLFENILKEKSNYKYRLYDYASQLNISTAYLSEVVKKTTGKSAKTLIQETIIYKAKTLLKQSSEDIATIAYTLGFNDASYFIKYFKNQIGLTPSKYRKEP